MIDRSLWVKMMEIFQEPTFTAFLALALFYVGTKIFTFAVSSSSSYRGVADHPFCERALAEDKQLRVTKADGLRKEVFIGDGVIDKVCFYQGSEDHVLLNDDGSTCSVQSVEESSDSEDRNLFDTSGVEIVEDSVYKLQDHKTSDDRRVRQFRDIMPNEKLVKPVKSESFVVENDDESGGLKVAGKLDEVEGFIEKSSGVFRVVEDKKDETDIDIEQEIGVAGCGENEGGVSNDQGEASLMKQDDQEVDNNVGEVCRADVPEANSVKAENEKIDTENDDWEGIESSELEKAFAGAVNYVEFGVNTDEKMAKLDNDALMELYGLHKVAVEGPCHEPQPMAFKLSARAKWNAWHKLGMISQEKAMEQYLRVLSQRLPGWSYADDDNPWKSEATNNLCLSATTGSAGKDDTL